MLELHQIKIKEENLLRNKSYIILHEKVCFNESSAIINKVKVYGDLN